MKRKRVVILGSTGSIGTQTLEVIRDHPDHFEIVGLTGYHNQSLLEAQVREFHPQIVATGAPETFEGETSCRVIAANRQGMISVATWESADLVVVATVGAAGLSPTIEALRCKKTICLANKEVLVMGGDILMTEAEQLGQVILPIDSEHSAIFQCLQGENWLRVRRIVVTASGGPFRKWRVEQLHSATPQDALRHPVWSMGSKITIDSATLMNKGLEVIEAHHLFNLPVDKISVVIHPQSIIHSMVEFADGAVMAQMGLPDMKIPIQFALSYPDRLPRTDPPLDLARIGTLTFDTPDLDRFPCLAMAYEACRQGDGYPTVLSVANEEAVSAFLAGKILFGQISELIDAELQAYQQHNSLSLDTILEIEQLTRISIRKKLERKPIAC
jgi:1-deoxy-D-xylulose-5-phosphate reductoisomerase